MALSNEVKLLLKLEAKEALGSVARLQYAASKVGNTVVQTQMKAYGDKVGETAASVVARALDSSNKSFAKIMTESANKAALALEQRIKLAAGETDPAAQAKHMRDVRSQMAAFEKLADKDVQEQLTKSWRAAVLNPTTGKELTTNLMESFERAFNDIDVGQLLGNASKGIGGKIAEGFKASAEHQKGLQSAALASGDTAGAAAAGDAAAAMSTAAVAVAGIAAALALAFAWMVAADDYQKKLNKTILDGASNADIFGKSYGAATATTLNLTDTLKAARGAAADTAIAFYLTADDTARVLNELNQAGVTYKTIIDGAKTAQAAQERFTEAIGKTISYASLLGVSTSELAQYQNTLMKDVNMSLDHTYDMFGMINQASLASGMSTKSFLTAISQATSGMALYNVRVEEAIGFIKNFGKIVGETDAGKFFEKFTKPGTPGDNLKAATTAVAGVGVEKVREIYKHAAETAAEDFYKNALGKEDAIKQVFAETSAAAGEIGKLLLSAQEADRKKGAEGLQKLSADDRAAIFTKLGQYGQGLNRRFEGMAELAVGAGSSDINVLAGVMDNLNATSKMLLLEGKLGVLRKEAGKGALGDAQTSATLQTFLGELAPEMSGEEQKGMLDIFIAQEKLLDFVKNVQAGKATSTEQGALRDAGLTIDGKTVKSASGKIIDDLTALLESNAEFAKLNAPKDEGTGAAMKQQENSITNALNAWVKGEIFETALSPSGLLGQILKFMPDSKFNPEKEAKRQEAQAKRIQDAVTKSEAAKTDLDKATGAAQGLDADSPQAAAAAVAKTAFDTAKTEETAAKAGAKIRTGRTYSAEDFKAVVGDQGATSAAFDMASTQYQTIADSYTQSSGLSDAGALTPAQIAAGKAAGWLFDDPANKGAYTIEPAKYYAALRDSKKALEGIAGLMTGAPMSASVASPTGAPQPFTLGAADALSVNDSLITANGKMYRPASDDNILTFKDGGPLDPARSGGGGPITININGGDQAMVYRTVTRALQAQGAR